LPALPSVAIVILNWNGKHYLQQFLPSVMQSQYGNLRIIVADNGSSDDSIAFLKKDFPTIEILQLDNNYGFAKGYNEALKRVEADYFILLNSDVEVTPGWIEPVINYMVSHPNVAACQPKILSFHNKEMFEYAGAAGGWIDAFGYPFSRGRVFDVCEKDEQQYNSIQKIFWSSGAAMFVRSELFFKAGGFDEFFFAHMEEIDLCWRMHLMGYEIYCIPQSVVYHVGGGTLPKGNSRKTFLNFRNNQIMMWKNMSWKEKWWKIPFRMGLDQLSGFKELLSGKGGYFLAVIRAHLAFVKWIIFGKKVKGPVPMSLKELDGVYKGNIVIEYFLRGKKKFGDIVRIS
jgi:GT2 family glycosyltransferase